VSGVVAQRRAISSLATPSAARRRAFAWVTDRCGNDEDLAIEVSALRWSSDILIGGAITKGMISP
jgi:hypothetical protein